VEDGVLKLKILEEFSGIWDRFKEISWWELGVAVRRDQNREGGGSGEAGSEVWRPKQA